MNARFTPSMALGWCRRSPFTALILMYLLVSLATAAVQVSKGRVPTTRADFHVPGTQTGTLDPANFLDSSACSVCHGGYDVEISPSDTWKGSLMGIASLDPLFQAQLTLAVQDAPGVGYYCLRCHAPTSIISGNAESGTIAGLHGMDFDGVSCHFCHSMVDPIYKEGISPAADKAILAALDDPPQFFGNAMFVLDPSGMRRGPRPDAVPAHLLTQSNFFKQSALCGTCHDVGNVAISRKPDGTYFYNATNEAAPDTNPHNQFPLERTFTEWSLSDFARGGVDMGGLFGGTGDQTVSSCQDCHMPKTQGPACAYGIPRGDLAQHSFAGATAWVLEITALHYADDPRVDVAALERGRKAAIDMLRRAATIEILPEGDSVTLRVFNHSGHKFPTGHIEGRRAWLNVKFHDEGDLLIREYGAYDRQEALLDGENTHVYEMTVGIDEPASLVTGLPVGETGHMSLANTIEKDTRIPPRGFDREAFANGGAPVVGADYRNGQYWDEITFAIPEGTARIEARVYYQTVTRKYIEELRDNNVTDDSGHVLYNLWLSTDKCPPIEVAYRGVVLKDFDANMWLLR